MGIVQGDLTVMPLADLVVWLANRRLSGVLTVEHEAIRKDFHLHHGMAIRAASNDAREYFGQFLVHFGLLTEDQLQRAYDTQQDTTVMLGRILVMIGIVAEEQVVQTLRVKIGESLLDAFRWPYGKFTFVSEPKVEPRPEIDIAIPLVDIHREGVARAQVWEQFNLIFPNPTHVLDVNDGLIPSGTGAETLDGRLIALARHGLNIEAMAMEVQATHYQIASRLFELYRLGVVRPRDAKSPPRQPQSTGAPLTPSNGHAPVLTFPHTPEGGHSVDGPLLSQLRAEAPNTMRGPHSEAVPVLNLAPQEIDPTTMTAKHRYILARVDGRRSVQAIIQVSPMHDVEAREILRQLEQAGIIRFEAPLGTHPR